MESEGNTQRGDEGTTGSGSVPFTRPLDEFIREFREDDNTWWREPQGDLLNHFEELLDRYEALAEEYARQRESERVALTLDKIREALSAHPRVCDSIEEDSGITCGWKRVVADVEAVLRDAE